MVKNKVGKGFGFGLWGGVKLRLRAGMVCWLGVALLLVVGIGKAFAQNGQAGIQEATTQVRSYFATGANLMYAIGAVMGIIGAVKVFQKWNGGDQDTGKVAAAWFGSCIFLVVVTSVLKSFFGV